MTFVLRDYQEKLIANAREAYRVGCKSVLLQLPTGGGKCLGKGTPILMFDGSIKAVEDVEIGDILMGPDSKPRNVLTTCAGEEMLYRVVPRKGDSYVVNESHILSLRLTRGVSNAAKHHKFATGLGDNEIVNIPVSRYISSSDNFKHLAKGWRASVNFPDALELPVDPYFLGIWLGDGNSRNVHIHSTDIEIGAWLAEYARSMGMECEKHADGGSCPVYKIMKPRSQKGRGTGRNILADAMVAIGVRAKTHSNPIPKHIPKIYKTASRQDRLKILAGLMDSDGSLGENGGYDYISKEEALSNDVAFVARSLGMAAYVKKCQKTCGNNGKVGTYYRVSISGELSKIPVILPRKKAKPRRQKKNVLNVGISVEPIGVGDYYGFEIDGDRLFMLGDFTVTHNTVASAHILKSTAEKGRKCLWVVHRREIILQASRTFWDVGIDHGLIMGGNMVDMSASVQIASVQTLARMLHKLPEYDLVCFDEAHHIPAAQHRAVFERFPDAWKLGLTATPWRLDRQGLGPWFDTMVKGPTVSHLMETQSLAPYRLFAPSQPDLSGVHEVGGDYNQAEVSKAMDKPKLVGDIIKHYQEIAPGTKAIVFACSIDHSRHIVQQFNEIGVAAVHVDGGADSRERDEAVAKFASGEIKILSNCALFDEGFDVPAVQTVICARPTQSLSMHLQQIGRGLRYIPGKVAIIIDHAGNTERHGLPDDDRDWSLEDRPKRKKGEQTTVSIKKCPKCFRAHKPASECPGCGFVYPIEVRQIQQEEGQLEEVDIAAAKKARKTEQGRAQSLDDLIKVGRARGMRNPHGWARNVIAARATKEAARQSQWESFG